MTELEKSEFMNAAVALAREAFDDGEVPIGAVIVRDGKVIAGGRNRRENGKNALYHAEIEAIDNACKTLGGWRLPRCTMFVTLEPCPMCAGAIINSRIEKVYFGAFDKKAGSVGSLVNLFELPYNHKPVFEGGVEEQKCAELLSDFFVQLRNAAKKDKRQ